MMVFFPRLSDGKLDKLSDIASDIGLVMFAAVVLPAVLDKFDPSRVIFGLVVVVVPWLISLLLKR